MPNPRNTQQIFVRWLILVYLPLALFMFSVLLLIFRVLSGGSVWFVALLGAYSVIPARALIETKRKGLAFPKPPGATARGGSNAGASRTGAQQPPVPAERASGRSRTPAAGRGQAPGATAKLAAPRPSAQILRRRALAAVVGIGALLLVGGILVVVGFGRVNSSFGLVMLGVGGFLMILSVTLPTFRLVDAVLRAIARGMSHRKPTPPPRRSTRQNK